MSSTQEEHIEAIQVLRGIAALSVVLWHSGIAISPFPDRKFFPLLEFPGVSLFFVISGFIICHIGFHAGLTVREFALRRLIRIAPIYWFFTAAIVCLHVVQPDAFLARRVGEVDVVIKSFAVWPQRDFPVLGVGWTLEHEALFYLLFAALLALGQQRRVLEVLLLFGSMGMLLRWNGPMRFWDYHLLSLFHIQFAVGVLIYRYKNFIQSGRAFTPLLNMVSAVGLLFATKEYSANHREATSLQLVAGDSSSIVEILGTGLGCGLILVAAIQCEMKGLLKSRFAIMLGRIGDASFTLYLSHQMLFVALAKIAHVLPDSSWEMAELYRVFAIGAAITFAILFYNYCERPLLAGLKRTVAQLNPA